MAYDSCRCQVARLVASGYLIPKEAITAVPLERIVAGLRTSTRAKPFAREFLRDCEAEAARHKTESCGS